MPTSIPGKRRLATPDAATLRSILVATDLSTQEAIAVQRAARVAAAHRALLTLMYMPARGQEPAADAGARLARTARQLEDELGSPVRALPAKPHRLDDLFAATRGKDLVVVTHRRERSTAAFFRGQPLLRLLRAARCPVLVVRSDGHTHYRRVLAAVDFGRESQDLARFAFAFDPRAHLELFHALGEQALRRHEPSDPAAHASCLQQARRRMADLTRSFETGVERFVAITFARGDAGHQVLLRQEHSRADLVAVGKRRSTAWEDFFCGSVAHRLLSWGSSDVLVVPLGLAPATAATAAHRLGALRAAGVDLGAEGAS